MWRAAKTLLAKRNLAQPSEKAARQGPPSDSTSDTQTAGVSAKLRLGAEISPRPSAGYALFSLSAQQFLSSLATISDQNKMDEGKFYHEGHLGAETPVAKLKDSLSAAGAE